MKLIRNIAELVNITESCTHILVLFNGSVDSSYLLHLVSQKNCRVTALAVDFGGLQKPHLSEIACYFPMSLDIINGQAAFAEYAIKPAIRAHAIFKGGSPISLPLSRPILAKIAVEYARKAGCEAIIHGSHHAFDLNSSISLLGYNGYYGSPYQEQEISSDQKQVELAQLGLKIRPATYQNRKSNLWCRSYELAAFEKTEDYEAQESLFLWSKQLSSSEPKTISITFSESVPTHVNQRKMDLVALIEYLNRTVGAFGVGRFSGLEHHCFGAKMLEVTEAPAAFSILCAYRYLEKTMLDSDTLQKKKLIEETWINEVKSGLWFSVLKESAENSIQYMTGKMNGTVNLSLAGGAMKLRSVSLAETFSVGQIPAC